MIEKQLSTGLKLSHDPDSGNYFLSIVASDGLHSVLWLNDPEQPSKSLKAQVKWAKEILQLD